jgi:hypothetical protein
MATVMKRVPGRGSKQFSSFWSQPRSPPFEPVASSCRFDQAEHLLETGVNTSRS